MNITHKALVLAVVALAALLFYRHAQAHCGFCGVGGDKKAAAMNFEKAKKEAKLADGVREITYEQLKGILKADKDAKLADVLSGDSFATGHIGNSISLPVNTIDEKSAAGVFKKSDKIIVYCASFQCHASTEAAKKLTALGYDNVLDYKGGLADWQSHGEKLAK